MPPKLAVAISGGGIAGLCLAAELLKSNDIRVDIYEASTKIDEIGAGITLWGRVCEALQLMGLANDCRSASHAVASMSGVSTASATEFRLRGFRQPDEDFGTLPFRDAWSLRRADLIRILLRRIPPHHIHLGKNLKRYVRADPNSNSNSNTASTFTSTAANAAPLTLEFWDGTHAACDALIGCDGIRSATRAQMMKDEAQRTRRKDFLRYVEPRWSGTVTYRCLVPSARLAARNPDHSLLSGGQIYLGKNQHIIGYPISKTTMNIAVSITDRSKTNTQWPLPAWSRCIDKETCKRKIHQRFEDWDDEAVDIIHTIDSSIEWANMDLEPLPFYAKGHVALIGDAAHAAVPYLGMSAACAIEDAYVLSRLLRAPITTRATLPLALDAFQAVRRPYGNKHVVDARLMLREFQYDAPHGGDMGRVRAAIGRMFEEGAAGARVGTGSVGAGGSGAWDVTGPDADANRGVFWMEVKLRTARMPGGIR